MINGKCKICGKITDEEWKNLCYIHYHDESAQCNNCNSVNNLKKGIKGIYYCSSCSKEEKEKVNKILKEKGLEPGHCIICGEKTDKKWKTHCVLHYKNPETEKPENYEKGKCIICGEKTHEDWQYYCGTHNKNKEACCDVCKNIKIYTRIGTTNKYLCSNCYWKRREKESKKFKMPIFETYSARGHYTTRNPISAIMNWIAILPAAALIAIVSGISWVLVELGTMVGIYKRPKK